MSTDLQNSTPNPTQNHVTTCASARGPRQDDTTPSFPQNLGTPPYMNREGTRIHALESTVQRMASDLSSSKEQIKEVKELLLRLINPTAATREPLPAFNRVPVVDLSPTQRTNEQQIPRPIHRDVIEHVPD
ncbi:hypothetical protein M758_3G100100, partial [Ceratodon purpureus]